MVVKRLWQTVALMILLAFLFSCGSPIEQPTVPKTWPKTFGGTLADRAYSIQQTSDGGYIVAGHTGYTGFFLIGEDVYILKLRSNGTILE